jgi:hypothetical protein
MHCFDQLVYRGTSFTLKAIKEEKSKARNGLQINGASSAVKDLQMLELQKAFLAIGMFSMFESILQHGLSCSKGFEKAKSILIKRGKLELRDRFDNFIVAINVLKHGEGRSYEALTIKYKSLPFRVKLPRKDFFFEGMFES